MTTLDYIEISSRFFIYNEVPNKIQLVTVNRVKMSHRTNSSLDDTIPLDKRAYELSDRNQTYYGSDLSASSGSNSNNSSVRIVYEVINLTESNSTSNSNSRTNQQVTLRFNK